MKIPFTVFAPSDAAFARLPKGTVETLLKAENKHQLVELPLLKAHVIQGRAFGDQVAGTSSVRTLSGDEWTIHVATHDSGGQLEINGAKVLKSDLQATNGVVHVIDRVLLAR